MSYGRGFEGSRLEMTKGLSRAEIAKLFRADVKDAIKRGDLPKGLKVSIRTHEYAGGGSINAKVTAVPEGFKVLHAARLYAEACCPHVASDRPYHTAEAAAVEKKLDALLSAYNFDDSDSMTDYFHVRFYKSVGFDWELEKAEKDAYKAAFAAGKVADPGEVSILEHREEVERLSELKEDPANEEALAATMAAVALGAPKLKVATPQVPALKGTGPLGRSSPTHCCAAALCTKGVTGPSDYCTEHRASYTTTSGQKVTLLVGGFDPRANAPEPSEYEAQLEAAGWV
jgi:hypothetical protein